MRLVGNWFLAPTAVVTADVTCGPGANIWFEAVVRGDVAPIRLGDNVNLRDGPARRSAAGELPELG
jgi:carbonic anhydrase/acetyltransferase-like protein (isoleucine patch superfamily)